MNKSFYNNFPNQLVSSSKRTDKWYKKCIDAAIQYIHVDYHGVRQTYENKLENYNLANDIFDPTSLKRSLTPLYMRSDKTKEFPIHMQHYPIATQKIDLLVGEEANRKFNFTARVTNDDAITEKENEKNKILNEFFISNLQNSTDPAEFKNKLQEKVDYINYDYQDKREKMANQILTYYYGYLDMREMFNRGYADLLISSEEIYRADVIGNEPMLYKCNPLGITVIGGSSSQFLEDADIIIEDQYMSSSGLIDVLYDYLTEKEIKNIESGLSSGMEGGRANITPMGSTEPDYIIVDEAIDYHQESATAEHRQFPTINNSGEIRVTRVVWKGKKRIGILTYFDENGNQQQEMVHEKYELDKANGDISINYLWINEALEGTRIGNKQDGIYVKMQPLPVQNRKIDNISKCSLGYVGVFANVNTNRAMSLMDRLKPFQFLYNMYMNKLNLIYAKYKGPIYRMDFSLMPDDYSVHEWMYYADILGWELADPFNEGQTGVAQGKLAGHMNQTSGVKDASLYNIIQQTIDMLNYIEMQTGAVSGITKAREGQIHQREAVSNVTREINQSAHITEKWFMIHDQVKRKALELFLEVAKYAFKNKSKKAQYVLDDMTTSVLEIDGELLNEAQYGIQITSSSETQELFRSLKELGHAGLQNDKLTFAQLMDIYTDSSIASIKRKIEKGEKDKLERDQTQLDQAKEIEQMKAQSKQLETQEKNKVELIKQANEIQSKILLARMEINSKEKISSEDRKLDKELAEMNKSLEEQKIKAIGKTKTSS